VLRELDFAEIRMDKMDLTTEDIRKIFSQPLTLIATCRPGSLDEDTRKRFLITSIEAGATYVDIEVESDSKYKKEIVERARAKGCKVIISFHDYEKTPEAKELRYIAALCLSEGGDIAKIACKVNSERDNARLLGLLDIEGFEKRLLVLGMGEKGKIARIVAPLLGSPFTFASYIKGKETAEGQIEKDRLEKIMRLLKDA
jgi:3-dehydroquinate dehydratase-1